MFGKDHTNDSDYNFSFENNTVKGLEVRDDRMCEHMLHKKKRKKYEKK